MASHTQIQAFTKQLKEKDNTNIAEFLTKIGKIFRVKDPNTIDHETILRTSELLTKIHEKLVESGDDNFTEDIELYLIECKADSYVLRDDLNNKNIGKNFYMGIPILGRKIIKLANLLSIFGITLL